MIEKSASHVDDRAIAARLTNKDQDALVEFIHVYVPKVRGRLKRAFDRIRLEDVDDAMQLALIRLWWKADTYNPDLASLHWFYYKIAERIAIDIHRRRPPVESLGNRDPSYTPTTADEADGGSANATRCRRDLEEVRMLLSPMEQWVFDKDLLAGGTANAKELAVELSKALGKKVRAGTVRVHRRNYRRKVRQALEHRGYA